MKKTLHAVVLSLSMLLDCFRNLTKKFISSTFFSSSGVKMP